MTSRNIHRFEIRRTQDLICHDFLIGARGNTAILHLREGPRPRVSPTG